MAKEEEEQSSSFKFVDKRRFNMDGELRDGADLDESPPAPTPAPEPSNEPVATAEARPAPEPTAPGKEHVTAENPKPSSSNPQEEQEDELPFLLFVQSLAQQAFMQMGLIPYPDGSQQLSLEQARQTVDILSMLQKKTVGNITDEEAELLQKALYELRMVYLEIVNNAGQPPGPPGTPG
jgi:hypothetical protein